MRVGAFIVGGDKESQTAQRVAITEYFLSTAASIDYFPVSYTHLTLPTKA